MKELAYGRIRSEIGRILPIFFNSPVAEPFVPFKTVEDYYKAKGSVE